MLGLRSQAGSITLAYFSKSRWTIRVIQICTLSNRYGSLKNHSLFFYCYFIEIWHWPGGQELALHFWVYPTQWARTMSDHAFFWLKKHTTRSHASKCPTWLQMKSFAMCLTLITWSTSIANSDPSVCKSNRLHVDILRFALIKLGLKLL